MRLTKIQRTGLTLLAKPGAILTRVRCMSDREPIRIVARDDYVKVAQVTFRSYLNRQWIYKTKEEWQNYRVVTYKITEAGRKVLNGNSTQSQDYGGESEEMTEVERKVLG